MEYIDSSMFYYAWKTKFIEAFRPGYLYLTKNIDKFSDLKNSKVMVKHFVNLFSGMIRILQKKLKEDGIANLKFYADIVDLAQRNNLISDKKMCFEIIRFSNYYFNDSNYAKNFKLEYMKVMDDFNNTFLTLIKKGGIRKKEYKIIDNSRCLWGLKKEYYEILIEHFKNIEKLKIVRIFGSRVTSNYKEFSDIDLILEGDFSANEFIKIKRAVLNIEIPYIRDIHNIFSEHKPFIYRNTLRSNIFYERKKYFDDNYVSPLS